MSDPRKLQQLIASIFRSTQKIRNLSRQQTAFEEALDQERDNQGYIEDFLRWNRIRTQCTGLFSSSLLGTINGITDQEATVGQRIGDKITLQQCVIKGMLELNERYSDVSVKVIVVKSAKGDAPTQNNSWQGASGNKLLDNFNTERLTMLKSNFIKMKAPNMAIDAQAGTSQTTGSGWTLGTANTQQSRATRMFSISIPGSKFMRGSIIQYENTTQQPIFFDYYLLFSAYSNYSTSAALGFNVARVNNAFTKLYYKDSQTNRRLCVCV